MLYEAYIDINFSNLYLMPDFEPALRNVLQKCFPDSIYYFGCYYHYLKSIIAKFKEDKLLKKKIILKHKIKNFFKLYILFC